MITASQARKEATRIDNRINSTLLSSIEKKINEAVSRGECSTQISYLTNQTVKKELESLGYKVENYSDPRCSDDSCTTISW